MPQKGIGFLYLCRKVEKDDMAINQIRKYIWLQDALRKHSKLTFKEVNELWLNDEISEGVELSIRTFHKWRVAIEDLFSINIENEGKGEYRYYISTSYGIDNNPFYSWLIDTFSLGNLMMDSLSLHKRILLEAAPSKDFLPTTISAMKEGKTLRLRYKAFWQETEKIVVVEPYCIKQFRQRWYLYGRHIQADRLIIYAFDRILEMAKEDKTFKLPTSFSANEHFSKAYGIIIGDETPEEKVVLKVSEWHAHYLRSLPLHHSQVEKESSDGYYIFEYQLCPTFDFQQAILSFASEVEVISPKWLRKKLFTQIALMYDKYNNEKE